MRQAITTKFLGPTNSRGSRIVAKAAAGRLTVHWDYGLNVADNHRAAAKAFADSKGWGGVWVGGGLPDDTGYVFVDTLGVETFTGVGNEG